jgi:16S rRNA G1207 methylase RsmC
MATELGVWHVGLPQQPATLGREDGVVAFTAAELAGARLTASTAVGFHEAMTAAPWPARQVDIHFPAYRSRTLIPVLSWLTASRLAAPDARVTWYLDKQQGPESFRRLLEELGWQLERERRGRTTLLSGRPPEPEKVELPPPRQFTAGLGSRRAMLAADYGVFSPEHIDDGTELLLGIALDGPPVAAVADIGTGYGPLAIGLLLNGAAPSATGTDVDCVALWLAAENALRNGVRLPLLCTPEPTDAPPTPLTVCSVPTHLNRADTEQLLAGLAARARQGRLLIAFHKSMEARYTAHLERFGLAVRSHVGPAHVVLDTRSSSAHR